MIRSSRDTGQWFDNNRKGSLKDRKYNKAQSPGMYDPYSKQLANKKAKISWNFGAVPFGTQDERFKEESRKF